MHADTTAGAPPLRAVTLQECESAPMPDHIIKGLCSAGEHMQIVATPEAGKSALAMSIGYNLARGLPVFGRKVRQCTVLYVACEDPAGIKRRAKAIYRKHGDASAFLIMDQPVSLMPGNHDIARIKAFIATHRPGLIIVDTFLRAFLGIRENDPDAMGHAISVIRQFTTICNSAVITLHHPTKQGAPTPRGHGALHADLDTLLVIRQTKSGERVVSVEKSRHSACVETFRFTIQGYPIGHDSDGDEVTAPLAIETPHQVSAPQADRHDTEPPVKIVTFANILASTADDRAAFQEANAVGLLGEGTEESKRRIFRRRKANIGETALRDAHHENRRAA